MTTTTDEDDERAEELGSLSAIYPELTIDPHNPFLATLDLEIAPSRPLLVRFVPDQDTAANGRTYAQSTVQGAAYVEHDVELSHLPPIHLQIDLPSGYPNEKPPTIQLRAAQDWMPHDKIQSLQEEVAQLWDEYGRCQVLFSYIDFLQQSAEDGFGYADSADGCLKLGVALENRLVAFNAATALATFRKGTYDCEICLEPKKGASCYQMENCHHVFCLQCLQDFYNNAINEGDIVNVRCLSPDCGKDNRTEARKKVDVTLHPRELLNMGIEEAKVRRYLELKRKKKLESDPSTVYCPRTWCQGAARSPKYPPIPQNLAEYVEPHPAVADGHDGDTPVGKGRIPPNPNDRLVICEKCEFAFCCVCYMGWHGPFQRCYPRDPNELSAEDKASYEYILKNTSPCPTCSSPTQKTMGCNHMVCFQCNSHFCYLCGSWLDANNPYAHFNTAGTPCYQRLWELEEGDEGQQPGDGHGFAGPRHAEQMAIEAARAAEAAEAEAALQADRQAEREAAELRLFALTEQDDASDDDDEIENHLRQMDLNANRHQPARVEAGNGPPEQRPRAVPRGGEEDHARPGHRGAVQAHGRGARPAHAGADVQRLQRFLDLAARDQEDEWDSDELGDEQDFVIR